ncbi:MAG: MFS transporter [Betaproteobacteria bacterium HGW-Betaproteobacteria-3]|jgi:predicted MFS family arabinose efflux permease|nr:MAG: MFS transporter [Betaproteobacteria bacterium HGW-Betaproteobacteria-3]
MAEVPATTLRSIRLLSFATFASMVTQRVCDAMLPELSRTFSASMADTAQVVSLFAVTYGVAQLWYGPLGDRFGKFRMVMLTTLACSVGSLLALVAASLPMLVVARVLVALFAAAVIPLSMAWVGDAVPYEQRQEMLAKLGLGSTFGIVGGQVVGGLFTDTLGWRWAFGFLTAVYLVVGALLWRDWRQQRARDPALAGAAAVPGPAGGFVRQSAGIVLRPWSRVVLLAAFVEGASAFGTLAIVATHLHQRLGLALSAAGAIVALFGAGGMLYMVVARALIRRLGETGLTRVGGVLFGLSFVALGYVPHWTLALPACLVAGFGFFMLHNTLQTNATQMAPEARGTGVTLFACALFLGQSVGVLVAAALLGRIGSAAVVAGGGGVLIVLALLFARAIALRDRVAYLG